MWCKNKILIFITAMLVTSLSNATTLVMMSHEEKAESASDILIGTVDNNVDYEWETLQNGNSILHTVLYIHVQKVLKTKTGIKVGDLVPVYRIGGKIHGLDMSAAGSPTFALDSRVMLFLFKDKNDQYRLIGFNQGKFRIFRQRSQPGGYLCLQDKGVLGAHILDRKTGLPVKIKDKDRRISLGEMENIIKKEAK